MKMGYLGISGLIVGFTLCGCDEAPDIQPLAPPGAYVPKTSPDADPAQALGEAAPTSSKSATGEAAKVASTTTAAPTAKGETKTTPGGVKYETLKEGTGPELKPGEPADIHYEGKLENGTVFDSSRTRKPLHVAIGTSPLIKGWVEAIPGMKVGEIRKLTIPSEMGYGKSGSPPAIPPDSTLIFEVELVSIDKAEKGVTNTNAQKVQPTKQ